MRGEKQTGIDINAVFWRKQSRWFSEEMWKHSAYLLDSSNHCIFHIAVQLVDITWQDCKSEYDSK